MELRVLRYFLAVVYEESISHAANSLHLSQPTLSRQLQSLEEELGKKLFIRGKRKITLTEAGNLLKQRAEEMIFIADRTEEELRSTEKELSGILTIASIESTVSPVLTTLLKEFHDMYPNVTYDIYSGTGDVVRERIDKGIADIGILIEPFKLEGYEYIRLLQKDVFGILTQKNSKLGKLEKITAEDLIGQYVVIPRRHANREELAHWFGKVFHEVQIIARYNLISNVIGLAETGMGNVICIEGVTKNLKSESLVFCPFEPILESSMVVVWKKNTFFSPTTQKFIELLHQRINTTKLNEGWKSDEK